VINTNLPPIVHRFRDIAVDRSKIAIFYYPLVFNSPDGGVPWDALRKIFGGYQQMAKVHNAAEILPKILIAWVRCTNVTDDRWQTTDRQTDRRTGDSI